MQCNVEDQKEQEKRLPYDDHKEAAQHLRQAKCHIGEDRPELGEATGGGKVRNRLLELIKYHASLSHGLGHARDSLEKDHVGRFDSDVAPAADGNANVGSTQRRRVVDAVAKSCQTT